MSEAVGLAGVVVALAQREVRGVLRDMHGIIAVVVATADGFDVASASRDDAAASRIAAMSSSMSAIGDVVSKEVGMGTCTSVTVQAEAGFAVVYRVRRSDSELVISVIADASAILAQVNYRAAQFARLLAKA